MHDTNLMAFKTDLHNVNWNLINLSPEKNSKYEKHFPLKDFKIKVKDLQASSISKGLKKLSKHNQNL